MRRPRLSIAGLMFAVLWTAVAIAALRTPSRLWAAVLLSAILAALTFSLLGALHARGPSRAFWSGFAISGWLFFAVHYAPWLDEHLGPCLVSTSLCDIAYELLHGSTATPMSGPFVVGGAPSMATVTEMAAVQETSLVSDVPTTVTRKVPQSRVIGGMGAPGVLSPSPLTTLNWWSEPDTILSLRFLVMTPPSFSRSANALLCIAFAYLGGIAARGFAVTASPVSRSSERSE